MTPSAFVALLLVLAIAGCATDYTKSEAPNALRVDGAESRVDVSFVPGSARLTPPDAVRQLVTARRLRPEDRVTIAAAGPPGLAEVRRAVLSRELLAYGIVADAVSLDTVPANQAIIRVGRYTITLPPCPNWSESPNAEYTNAHTSNWGCAAATNLGLMVAHPADLVSGRPLARADAMPAAAAVDRYLNDKIKQLQTPGATPFTAPTEGGAPGGAAPGGGAGGGTP